MRAAALSLVLPLCAGQHAVIQADGSVTSAEARLGWEGMLPDASMCSPLSKSRAPMQHARPFRSLAK